MTIFFNLQYKCVLLISMVVEKFQIYGVKITEKYMCEWKNWICSFLLLPLSKTLSQTEWNYPFYLNSIF